MRRVCQIVRALLALDRSAAICHHRSIEQARVDQWIWAVRLTRTRSAAADACRAGHVQVNARSAKPSTPVRVGDTVRIRIDGRERLVEVREPIIKRVGAARAAECLIDHSPPVIRADHAVAPRERGSGRPTKRERRQLDRLRGR